MTDTEKNIGIFILVAITATIFFATTHKPLFVWFAIYGLVAAAFQRITA